MSKIIAITGAGAGLGRALARRLASEGETIVLLGRTLSKVQAAAEEIGGSAMALECDVGSADSVRSAFAALAERHPRIDVLINNAAIYEPFTVVEATDAQIWTAVTTNLAGPIFCTRAAVPMMGRGAHIINISSETVELPHAMLSLYQATKAGLERFSQSMDLELEPNGIRVTTVRAGQMMVDPKEWAFNPDVTMRFGTDNLARGLNLRERPISDVNSVTGIFRALIDLPPDVHVATMSVHARKA